MKPVFILYASGKRIWLDKAIKFYGGVYRHLKDTAPKKLLICNPNNKVNFTMKTESSKILITYYSWSGNTRYVAETIHNLIGGDLFEILPMNPYPDKYNDIVCLAKKEINANFYPKLKNKIDLSQYDTVFIGSPNWWGTITPIVRTFLYEHDLTGKKVIPFITHGGGGSQNTIMDMAEQYNGDVEKNNGWVGYGNSTTGLKGWLESISFLE